MQPIDKDYDKSETVERIITNHNINAIVTAVNKVYEYIIKLPPVLLE